MPGRGGTLKRKASVFSLGRSRKENQGQVNIPDGLKFCYAKVLRPFEEAFLFSQFHSATLDDAHFDAKPMVLLVGQYSTGKTTFIRYLLGEDFPGIRIGPEPTTDKFNIIMHSPNGRNIVPGNALVVDHSMEFRPLEKFGNTFLNRLQCSLMDSDVLRGISLVDTPGVLAGQKHSVDRGYDFTAALEWFASRSDRILLLFDAHKLDVSDELRRAIQALKGHDDKIRIVLNKSDLVEPQQLMRIYGALMWSLGKVFDTPEVVRVYIGSFWDQPLANISNRELFEREELDLFEDLKSLPRHSTVRKLNEFIKRARLAKIHALIICELAKSMPTMFGKEKRKKEQIDHLDGIYTSLQEQFGVSPGDFPDLETMKSHLRNADWSQFRKASTGADKKLMERVDKMLKDDMAHLMSAMPASGEGGIVLNGPIEAAVSTNTPFQSRYTVDSDRWEMSTPTSDEWIVAKDPECLCEWENSFNALLPLDGKVTGRAAKSVMTRSRLPNTVLSKIWTMSDIDQDGMLDHDEFCLAMYLIRMKISGKDLPHGLPKHFIPPSKR